MFKQIEPRLSQLATNKTKLVVYILLCIIILISLTVVPLYLWMTSDLLTRGVTSIRGDSMAPTFKNNDILYTQPTKFERGEIVVVICPQTEKYSTQNNLALLKRIVGLPGETIEIIEDGLLIDGVLLDEPYTTEQNKTLQDSNDIDEIILSDNEYFILGDNRSDSLDSRHVGAIRSVDFLYSLTTDPNEHTYKIWGTAALIAVANLIGVIFLPIILLVIFSPMPKQKREKAIKGKKSVKTQKQYSQNKPMVKSEDVTPKSKTQPKSVLWEVFWKFT